MRKYEDTYRHKGLRKKLIDGIIKEPIGGAHSNTEEIFKTVKAEIKKHLDKLLLQNAETRINERIEKFSRMGVFLES